MGSSKKLLQQTILRDCKTFIVYGVSRTMRGYAFDVVSGIRKMRPDARFVLVHPESREIGDFEVVNSAKELFPAFQNGAEISHKSIALVILDGKRAIIALEDLIGLGIENIWLVMNALTKDTAGYAESNNLNIVKGCPLLFTENTEGIHKLHFWLARFFGRV